MINSIKPCPNCGNSEHVIFDFKRDDRHTFFWLRCTACRNSGPIQQDRLRPLPIGGFSDIAVINKIRKPMIDHAIDAWNSDIWRAK